MNDFNTFSDLTNLFKAYSRVRLGKRTRPVTLTFDFVLENCICLLQYLLRSKKYVPKPYTYFIVTDPKKRHIAAPNFRDRIVHRSLVNLIEPRLDKEFIFDSYACRKGKGTHFGLQRVKKFLMAARSKNGAQSSIYYLKCDIRKYFQSISWDVLITILQKKISDPDIMKLIATIITNHKVYKTNGQLKNLPEHVVNLQERKGIPIGNLTSQLFANVYLNELDQFVKHTLKEKWYARYMDDFLIIHPDKDHLIKVRNSLEVFLEENLKLTLHPEKVFIQNLSFGVPFVGYRIFYDHILVRGKTLRRFQKRLEKRKRMVCEQRFTQEKLDLTCNSFQGHIQHANAYHLQKFLFSKKRDTMLEKIRSRDCKCEQLQLPF
jgi:RNA-directed DNA polymerase